MDPHPAPYDAIVVVSFGGPEAPEEIMPFLRNVTRGRDVPEERLALVAEQYMATGGRSPINDQNRALVDALSAELAAHGHDLPVYWGNRNWAPYLTDTVEQMHADGVRRALAFVTSAYSSYSACRQYLDDIEAARAAVGEDAPVIDKIRQFWNHPGFVEPLREGVVRAVDALTTGDGALDPAEVRLVGTAHSLPMSMAQTSDYELQLRDALDLVAESVPVLDTDLVWQSRSGPPQVPWLEPDVNDHLRHLAAEGVHRPGNTVEPGIERGNHLPRLGRFGERGEAAEVGAEQHGADRLPAAPPQRAALHPCGAAPAEIGLEQRGHGRPRRQRGERRCREARDLAQAVGIGRREGLPAGPGQHRALRRRP